MKLMMTMAVIASVLAAQSCILEDRTGCPTYLTLDLSSTPEEVGLIHLILEHEDGITYRDTVYRDGFLSGYEIPVRKGRLSVAAFGNPAGMVYDRGYTVPAGEQADSLYTCFFSAEYSSELSSDTVRVMRNFIGLHIRILGQTTDTDSLKICVESSSVGYDLHGNIITGAYSHSPAPRHLPDSSGWYYEYSSRLTRLAGENLSLTVSTVSSGADVPLIRMEIAEYIRQTGMSMDDDELGDVYVTVDFARASITVSPVDWNYNRHVEISI